MSTSDTTCVIVAILSRLRLDPSAPDGTPADVAVNNLWVALKTMNETGQPVLYPIPALLEHLRFLYRPVTLGDIRIVLRFHVEGYEALVPLLQKAKAELGPTRPLAVP